MLFRSVGDQEVAAYARRLQTAKSRFARPDTKADGCTGSRWYRSNHPAESATGLWLGGFLKLELSGMTAHDTGASESGLEWLVLVLLESGPREEDYPLATSEHHRRNQLVLSAWHHLQPASRRCRSVTIAQMEGECTWGSTRHDNY